MTTSSGMARTASPRRTTPRCCSTSFAASWAACPTSGSTAYWTASATPPPCQSCATRRPLRRCRSSSRMPSSAVTRRSPRSSPARRMTAPTRPTSGRPWPSGGAGPRPRRRRWTACASRRPRSATKRWSGSGSASSRCSNDWSRRPRQRPRARRSWTSACWATCPPSSRPALGSASTWISSCRSWTKRQSCASANPKRRSAEGSGGPPRRRTRGQRTWVGLPRTRRSRPAAMARPAATPWETCRASTRAPSTGT
mmetsp:Transcript_1471/g.3921  ORF Transcript_1471/g.3921 Transcript_1471/m.3921 type:complete len:254 (+) Transcript_1471:1664-2425(+)